uniref:ARAD1D40062p n=1 Tax=Blastobotrys adeninivorans TaxID=409370 RepID=A0A060TD51_BLAAD
MDLTSFNAHHGPIHALAVNHKGTYALSGGQDKLIHLWNVHTRSKVLTYSAHSYPVLDIALTQDSSRFASAGGDRSAFLWDVSSGSRIARYGDHSARINSVAFNTSASVLATASYDTTVKLWDLRSNSFKPLQVLKDAKDSVNSAIFSGVNLITGSVDGMIRTYDMRNCKMITDVVAHPITCVRDSPDSNCLLVSSLDSTLRLFDKANGTVLQRYKGHVAVQYRTQCGFVNHGEWIASMSEDGMVYIWDFLSGEVLHRLTSKTSIETLNNSAFALATGGDILATSSLHGRIDIWTKKLS